MKWLIVEKLTASDLFIVVVIETRGHEVCNTHIAFLFTSEFIHVMLIMVQNTVRQKGYYAGTFFIHQGTNNVNVPLKVQQYFKVQRCPLQSVTVESNIFVPFHNLMF